MSLPVLSKVYQFTLNNVAALGGTALICNQNLLFGIKQGFLAFGTLPMTCWGSSDGVGACGNGDLNDRWGLPTNLVWAASGVNHSWIVLQQSGLDAGGKASICLDCNSATTANLSIILSPSAGFGVANGGADGTPTGRPTATDQVVLLSAASYGGPTGFTQRSLFSMLQSTDGQVTIVLIFRAGSPVGIWIIDKANNPKAAWTSPVFGWVMGYAGSVPVDTTVVSYTNLITANLKAFLTAACSGQFTGEGDGVMLLGQAMTFADEDSGDWPMPGVGIYFTTAGHRGQKGDVFDLWWSSTARASGTPYPKDAAAPQFMTVGNLIVPWNGVTALIMT